MALNQKLGPAHNYRKSLSSSRAKKLENLVIIYFWNNKYVFFLKYIFRGMVISYML